MRGAPVHGQGLSPVNTLSKSLGHTLSLSAVEKDVEKEPLDCDVKESESGRLHKPRRSITGRPGLRWRGGHCTKLGQRTKNEDRFVVAPNVHDRIYNEEETKLRTLVATTSAAAAPANTHLSSSYSRSTMTAQTLSALTVTAEHTKHQFGGGHDKSVGYFAVYDGHCGDAASILLEEQLMDRIYK
jgi:hypothetical protein